MFKSLFFISLVSLILHFSSFSKTDLKNIIENNSLPYKALEEKLECSASIKIFYTANQFEQIWNKDNFDAYLKALNSAEANGLIPSDYFLSKLKEINFQYPLDAEKELFLSNSFFLFTSHMLSGKINPVSLDKDYGIAKREGNPIELLKTFANNKSSDWLLSQIEPQHEVYQNLKKALKQYKTLEEGEPIKINSGITIKPGDKDVRIFQIKKKLFQLQYINSQEEQFFYDETLQEAIQLFQKRHGIKEDGDIGNQTIERLNISIAYRIKQIKANLERWRWLPNNLGNYYLIVNIANFELEVIKNNEIVKTHRIIVGKPFRKTPVFSSQMKFLVFNPDWTVPPGIIKGDIIPGAKKDPNFIQKKRLNIYDSNGKLLDPSHIDWTSSAPYSYTYKQPPGKENALGAVKFMFPNSHHVYLHDTPSKDLFEKEERAFSSGCIRVQNPLLLAEYLLDDPKWNGNKIEEVVKTEKTQTVQLKEQPMVYLLYWTAWQDATGAVHFRKDIYERDQTLITALGL